MSIVPQGCSEIEGEKMGTKWGYARVSTEDQELGLQVTALRDAGVPEVNIVTEKASGKAGSHRPLYAALLGRLKAGDSLVVWKVDRLGRSTLDALTTAKELHERGVHIIITTLGIDLKTPTGELVFGIMMQIAQFERTLIKERVKAGMAEAKRRGDHVGRKHTLKQDIGRDRRLVRLRPYSHPSRYPWRTGKINQFS
jgi:DNA invertase Pin-like site-specific DNA recombinase